MRALIAATLLGCLVPCLVQAQDQAESTDLCKEFRRLLSMPRGQGLDRSVLDNSLMVGAKEDGEDHYFNLDIDGDDVNDVVTRGCPGSPKSGDPCVLQIRLSSGGSITFEEDRFFLARFRGKIYAVDAETGPKRKIGSGRVFRVGPKNVQLVCKGV